MKKFIECFRCLKELDGLGSYRLCWMKLGSNVDGFWTVMDFTDDELDKIDPNKIEIVY